MPNNNALVPKHLEHVHPELRTFFQTYITADLNPDRLAELRSMRRRPTIATLEGVNVRETHIPGRLSPYPVRVVIFEACERKLPSPAILHIHGGGYLLGSPEESGLLNQQIARRLGCVVFSVDYRLAPEFQFPEPLHDCHAVLEWMHQSAESLGIDPAKIAVKGESAGGGLAACLAALARDRDRESEGKGKGKGKGKGCPIALQVLVAPMVDDQPGPTSARAGEFVWTRRSDEFAWASYLGGFDESGAMAKYASAVRVSNLEGLPPTFIAVGALDLYLDQDLEYARRLIHAGVATEVHVYPGAPHSFHRAGDTSLNQRLNADCQAALKAAFG